MIVGSGPGSLENEPDFIDGHQVVVRVNNYRLRENTGIRTDVFYSFFGKSIKKDAEELQRDGVTLCMCKCPDAHVIHSPWHVRRRMMNGVDFRYIYRDRADWWFCETYVPAAHDFIEKYNLLGGHVPTTGFAAILDILEMKPRSLYLTGFDFFRSGLHNVSDPWVKRNDDDPIRHIPEAELRWLSANSGKYPMTFDRTLTRLIATT